MRLPESRLPDDSQEPSQRGAPSGDSVISSRVRGMREPGRDVVADPVEVLEDQEQRPDGAPPRPTSPDLDAQGFVRARPVRWFHPGELVRTGIRALLASVFGTYADRREMEAALHALPVQPEFDYSVTPPKLRNPETVGAGRDEIWIDFVADTGDGFDSTYTMARVLAEPTLTLGGEETPRGNILILGGDEVYPAATRAAYENRTLGPFRAALPYAEESRAPHVFAIPGNHDWYDGLAAFLRLFTQGRWMGGWKTHQSRSYFALQLPHRYWLWGTDIQLAAEIDGPQLEYFRAASAVLSAGDRVILCTAEPCWIRAEEEEAKYRNLAYLIEKFIDARDAQAVLILTGDSHHYARYALETATGDAESRAQMYVTAGGGGAFLHGTHTLPAHVVLPDDRDRRRAAPDGKGKTRQARLLRRKRFPAANESKILLLRAWRFPIQNYEFAGLWAALWFVFTWALQTASLSPPDQFGAATSFLGQLTAGAAANAPAVFGHAVYHSPIGILFLLSIVIGCAFYANTSFARRLSIGALHASLHLGGWLCTLLGTLRLLHVGAQSLAGHFPLFAGLDGAVPPVGMLLGTVLAGGVSGVVFALFLCFAGYFIPKQLNDAFSALGVEDFKNFVRLHIAPDGSLRVFPVGVRRVAHDFRVNLDPNAPPGAPWIEPTKQATSKLVGLIERPFTLPPDAPDQAARWEGDHDPH
jgi:hypothetical protein